MKIHTETDMYRDPLPFYLEAPQSPRTRSPSTAQDLNGPRPHRAFTRTSQVLDGVAVAPPARGRNRRRPSAAAGAGSSRRGSAAAGAPSGLRGPHEGSSRPLGVPQGCPRPEAGDLPLPLGGGPSRSGLSVEDASRGPHDGEHASGAGHQRGHGGPPWGLPEGMVDLRPSGEPRLLGRGPPGARGQSSCRRAPRGPRGGERHGPRRGFEGPPSLFQSESSGGLEVPQ